MQNIPAIKLGIIAVSRDCFPIELSHKRRSNVVAACKRLSVPVVEIETIIEFARDREQLVSDRGRLMLRLKTLS